ncbi:uncharacterized protein PV06_11152 [Exophiala oligosperma]|uniref:Uncharacterized protein n=1 Tax=Exophiala oligosperma TaxID=215243 RepID=A0A0D2D307_9EURO|nr:uncharacterized protein PV06_11152 [Exophiala oligosperma]KIW36640.1 hypothetical protein PV06_11152 [Exophiala oligosperma]
MEAQALQQRHSAASSTIETETRRAYDSVSSHRTPRPTLESWHSECLLAHRVLHGRLHYLVKVRPVWQSASSVPYEAEAEYWNKYPLEQRNINTKGNFTENPRDQKDEAFLQKKPNLSPSLAEVDSPREPPSPMESAHDNCGNSFEDVYTPEDDMLFGSDNDGDSTQGEAEEIENPDGGINNSKDPDAFCSTEVFELGSSKAQRAL